jgi:Mg-chelatase subunit ChlD
MNSIRIEHPWLLMAAIPLVIAVVVGFFLLPKEKRRRPKNLISFGLHLVICFTLALSFANIQFLNSDTKTELYLVVDTSASEKGSTAEINKTIRNVYSQVDTNTTKVGVVAFANNYEVLVKPGDGKIKNLDVAEMYDTSKHPHFDPSASNIEKALTETNKLFSEKVVRRMILISDGQETDGNAIDVIDELVNQEVNIDAINIHEGLTDEVAITGLQYTDHAFLNHNESVKVSIKSKKSIDNATVELISKGLVLQTKESALTPGLSIVTFDNLPNNKVGSFDYLVRVNVDPSYDTFKDNNERGFTQDFTDKFSTLIITPDEEDITEMYRLGLANKAQTKEWVSSDELPTKLDELIPYDEIIMSNVNLTMYEGYESFVTNLNTAVKTYGKSLLTFGAAFTDNKSDESLSAFNDLLPVQYQAEETKALVLVIDCSGSMDMDNRLEIAKKGAIAVLSVLGENDYISIVTFSDNADTVVSLTSASNRDAITRKINNIQTVGGTAFLPGFKAAYNQLKDSTAEYKHVITLSDGEPWDEEKTQDINYVRRMAGEDIVWSFINICNPDGADFLKTMARRGNGTYYYCRRANDLVDIMMNSVSQEIKNTSIDVEDGVEITFRKPDDPVLSGITSLPSITGFNYGRIKNAATTVMTVPFSTGDTEDSDGSDSDATVIESIINIPLYAYWNYGKGKVASFTSAISDANNDWTDALRSSASGQKFFSNVASTVLPDRATDNILDISYVNNGTTSSVTITANDNNPYAKVTLDVTQPNGQAYLDAKPTLLFNGEGFKTELTLASDADGKIQTGKYTLKATYVEYDENGKETAIYRQTLALYFDYSVEYDVFTDVENTLLYDITKKANGTLYENTLNVQYSTLQNEIQYLSYFSTMMIFLIISVALYLLDIFVRKSDFKKKNQDLPKVSKGA